MEQAKALERLIAEWKLSEALDMIEAMPQEERQQWQVQNLTGVICSCCGQFSEAETFFSAALEQQPDDLDVMFNLADAYAAQGKRRKAEALLQRCEQQDSKQELAEDIAHLHEKLAGQKGGRVLMAAYYFPPLSGSGVFRSLKFAKYLPQFGWQPTVISTDRPPNGWNFADASMVAEIPEGMEVIRIPDGISTGRKTTLDGDRVQAILNFLRGVLRYSPDADRMFTQLSQSREGIRGLLTFPCAALSWAYDVVQYIEKNIDLDKFEAVYTTSGPSSAHLIGFYLKQKYGIPWVADFRDPWTLNPYGSKYDPTNPRHKLLFELESVLLHQADRDLTVEESAIQMYIKEFHLDKQKIASITNGYDEVDFTDLIAPTGKTPKFTLNYSGLLYTSQRSIVPVLQALQQLKEEKKIDVSKIQFRIVGMSAPGNIEVADRFGLGQIIRYTGYLSHREALQANLDSNLLLLLVGDELKFKSVYTGKIFEYLRSGRPILALAPKDGVVDRVLRESGHGKAFLSTQVPEIKSMILREYQRWERGEGIELLHSPAIKRFERKILTGQLARVLETVKNDPVQKMEIPSDIYDMGYRSGGAGGSYHKHYSQSIDYHSWKLALSYLKPFAFDTSILEIGCGAGQFANMLFDYGFSNYTGFDYAAEGVALAKKNNPKHADRFFVADAFQTELMEKEYGLVISFEVLEHIQKDLELLNRIRPGTKMLLSVPNFSDPYHVRFFPSEKDVRERYGRVMKIIDISVSMSNETHCLYYVWGEKI